MKVKLQIGCIIILFVILILFFMSKPKKSKTHLLFLTTVSTIIVQIILDIMTVYTVNSLDAVSLWVNRLVHRFFFLFFFLSFFLLYNYFVNLISEQYDKKFNGLKIVGCVLLVIAIVSDMFLPFEFIETPKGNYSMGPAVYMIYGNIIVYVIVMAYILVRYGKTLVRKTRAALGITFSTFIIISIFQAITPTALISSLGFTIMCLGCYLSVENPDSILAEQLREETIRADNANNAKNMFLAKMSHEIRTPINAVLGSDEMILRESNEKHIKRYAADLKSAANSILSIINDILDISKIEEGKLSIIPVEYDVSSMIHDVINMIGFKAKAKGLEFNCHIDSALPCRLYGDDIRIRQIIINILNNAVKYTEKGSVCFKVSLIDWDQDSATINVSVSDTGIGMKKEELGKLFEPFERLDEKRNRNIEGTGLGMSISTQLLDMMGSSLNVESIYGEGSTFSFRLKQGIVDITPLGNFEKRMEQLVSTNVTSTRFTAPDAKILMVDDNAMNRKVFAQLLKRTKVKVTLCESGKECLDLVKKEYFDMIFMDHMMPDIDGIETFHYMKELGDYPCKDTPVIILTANAVTGAKEMYLKEGFNDFLSKPIVPEKLEQMIEENISKSLIHDAADTSEDDMQGNVNPDIQDMPVIDGVDYELARTHFADDESLLDMFRMFRGMINDDADELENYYGQTQNGMFNEYRIKVHSMKNSAATVGIVPLAGMAKVLEDAARNEDIEVITRLHGIFILKWREYYDKLDELCGSSSGDSEDDGKRTASDNREVIADLLKRMFAAAQEMDIDLMDSIMKELDDYSFSGEEKEKIHNLRKAVSDFDVDYITENLK